MREVNDILTAHSTGLRRSFRQQNGQTRQTSGKYRFGQDLIVKFTSDYELLSRLLRLLVCLRQLGNEDNARENRLHQIHAECRRSPSLRLNKTKIKIFYGIRFIIILRISRKHPTACVSLIKLLANMLKQTTCKYRNNNFFSATSHVS